MFISLRLLLEAKPENLRRLARALGLRESAGKLEIAKAANAHHLRLCQMPCPPGEQCDACVRRWGKH